MSCLMLSGFNTCFCGGYNRKIKLSECVISRKGKTHSQFFGEIKAFEAKLKLCQRQLRQYVFDHFPCLQSALEHSESDKLMLNILMKL